MTDEGQKQADEVLTILGEALGKVESFYDCRIVLGSLVGVTSGFAASLFRAGVLPAQGVAEYFAAGLTGAFEVNGKTPHIHFENQTSNGAKQ